MVVRRVAVIGAGASGLTAIKCCLDEGLEPVCFERSGYIGGLWHYTDEVEENQACVMKSTVINTSKEMMSYSDFPIPAEFAIFMHNRYVDEYFNMYAKNFGLNKYINLHTEIVSVKRSAEGNWELEIRHKKETSSETFDAVMVCTGHHAEKNVPSFPGLDMFKGKVTHTHDYKDFRGYEDKRVLIIGIGNSGGDVANELSRISSQVYLSTRSGAWLFNRVSVRGDPLDMVFSTRFINFLRETFPTLAGYFQMAQMNRRFDHGKYSIQPTFSPFACHPTINDELPNRIISGGVIVKANVCEFTETGAKFEDGTAVDDIDAVVMATGYIFGFPFIDKSIIDVKENKVDLYKYMFPPEVEENTLAVIGCFQPLGAIMPLSEMQCRVATRVFKKDAKLPSKEEMWREIHEKSEAMSKRYKKSLRHTIQVEYIPFMDELAALIGCKPELKKMITSDPKLAYHCFFGPATPYQYRLDGPGAWEGAKKAILTQWERTYKPLCSRPCDARNSGKFGMIYIVIAVVLVFIAYCILT